jgi:hypothetical protein
MSAAFQTAPRQAFRIVKPIAGVPLRPGDLLMIGGNEPPRALVLLDFAEEALAWADVDGALVRLSAEAQERIPDQVRHYAPPGSTPRTARRTTSGSLLALV